eukprot:m.114251 g.114251  ORF g.114251 m.114251 type:complete len:53 (+) comp37480_c0_seq1:1841-1999(+)
MPNSDFVCTRFFFVYDDQNRTSLPIDTQTSDFRKEIVKALSFSYAARGQQPE